MLLSESTERRGAETCSREHLVSGLSGRQVLATTSRLKNLARARLHLQTGYSYSSGPGRVDGWYGRYTMLNASVAARRRAPAA